MTQNNFLIRTYGKSEFALLMFPTIDDPKVAQAKLLRWIKKDRQFHQSLVGMGLSSHDKDYSPEQVRKLLPLLSSCVPLVASEQSSSEEGLGVVCARLCRLLPSGRKNKGQCNICGQL